MYCLKSSFAKCTKHSNTQAHNTVNLIRFFLFLHRINYWNQKVNNILHPAKEIKRTLVYNCVLNTLITVYKVYIN